MLTPSGNDTVSGNTITADPGNDTSASAVRSVLVYMPGPVHRIELVYSNAGTGGQVITLTNMTFTTLAPTDGNDVIDGDAGNDLTTAAGPMTASPSGPTTTRSLAAPATTRSRAEPATMS